MKAKRKANLLLQADPLSKLASKLQVNYTYFLRKLQGLRALPSFPSIVVGLGYVALFILFIFWRV